MLKRVRFLLAPSMVLVLTAVTGCRRSVPSPSPQTSVNSSAPSWSASSNDSSQVSEKPAIAEIVYDGGLRNDWQDWGWSEHKPQDGGALGVRFDNWGGLIFSKPNHNGEFGGLRFALKTPLNKVDFLGVRLESNGTKLPSVQVSPEHCSETGNGWVEVSIPFEQLNPDDAPVVDRIIFFARKVMTADFVEVDKVVLTKRTRKVEASYNVANLRQIAMKVDCRAKSTRVSPYIFGFAYYAFDDEQKQRDQWALKGTVRRWGGNTTSTYNWEIGAWNTGNDWFFENHPASHDTFLSENAVNGVASALTVPIMGWVSKDKTSSSFPVSAFGEQAQTDTWRKDAGNGKDKSGKLIKPGSPTRAYQPAGPEFVKRWVESIRKKDAQTGKRSVWMYILDNEPMIWSTNHRDAHPEPVSYDELVKRTIEYGTAVRTADPEAVIAGPAEWGWVNYLYSGKDMANGGPSLRPDRRSHGDLPVVAYYLKALADHEKKTGVRVLDVLDLHAYPYADGVCSPSIEPDVLERRIRSTRALWDPSYVDESWVKEPVNLLPRMRSWIGDYYPGRGISIGEWNFGALTHMSGALATAEALGRYAQFGLTSAFFWTYPPKDSPTMWAFRAYRDFDGKGSRFLDWFTPASVASGPDTSTTSIFASRDEMGKRLTAVVLNFSRKEAVAANIDLASCGSVEGMTTWTYDGHSRGFVARNDLQMHGSSATQPLPPYSISVLDVNLRDAAALVR